MNVRPDPVASAIRCLTEAQRHEKGSREHAAWVAESRAWSAIANVTRRAPRSDDAPRSHTALVDVTANEGGMPPDPVAETDRTT